MTWLFDGISSRAVSAKTLFIAGCVTVVGSFLYMHMKLQEAEASRTKAVELRQAERKGRIKAELRLKEALTVKSGQIKTIENGFDTETTIPAITHQPIGVLKSCYKTRNGTPRQGVCVESAKSVLYIPPSVINAEAALQGLEEYTHVWLIYSFHANTNMGRGSAIKAKIAPPRLGGKDKVGLYSTRTPHRPNNIGLSLVRLDKVIGRKVYFNGADLIDMTPILDIKPYIPYADVPVGDVKFPQWVKEPPVITFHKVLICDSAREILDNFVLKRLKLYKGASADDIVRLISDVLKHDIRSGHQKQQQNETYVLFLDNMRIEWTAQRNTATVQMIGMAKSDVTQ
eukprot:CFRG4077T1